MLSFGGALLWRKIASSVGKVCSYSMILNLAVPMERLASLVVEHGVKPVVGKVLPLDDVRLAHAELESHRARGKVILKVATA